MCLNPVNEEFDRAYANVGLLASDVWSYQSEEIEYKKANLHLWIRFNETEKRLIEEDNFDIQSASAEAVNTVQDVIPFSRLATYNNFEYNEGREKIYVVDDEPPQYIQISYQIGHNELEVWMLPEVEKEFKKYTKDSHSGWCMLSTRYPSGRELVPIGQITNASPQQWLSETQWPNRLLSHYAEKLYCLKLSTEPSLFRNDLEQLTFDPEDVEMKLLEYPCPRYLIETNIDHRLHEVMNSLTIRSLWATPSYPYGSYSQTFGLNAEVPEFVFSLKLKVEGQHHDPMNITSVSKHQSVNAFTDYETSISTRRQHYISIFDMNYEADVFPYSGASNGHIADTETTQILINEDFQNNPELTNPSGYFISELLDCNWNNNEQEDAVINCAVPPDSGEQTFIESQNTENVLPFLEKWVSKMYYPRSVDFNEMSSSSGRINQIFQNVQQGYCSVQGPTPVFQPPTLRPLYSDVLMSEVNPALTSSESKFDELEQEALEQYSGSDTMLAPPPEIPVGVQQDLQHYSEVLEAENSSEVFSVKPPFQDLEPPFLSSPLSSPGRECRIRKGNLLAIEESVIPEESCEARKENELELKLETNRPMKQAKWMKKKKKRLEKKKKMVNKTQHNKKKQPLEHQRKFVHFQIALINRFLDLSNTFHQIFFLDDWKLVYEQLVEQDRDLLERCLNIFEKCVEWFMFLITDNNGDLSNVKIRIELLRKSVGLLGNVLQVLQHYVFLYDKIKMTIPCDHRLYFDTETLTKQTSITPLQLSSVLSNNQSVEYSKIGLLSSVLNSKYFLRLQNYEIQEERLTSALKHEWKLPLALETPVRRKSCEIQINFKEWRIQLTESKVEKEETTNLAVNQKLVKIVEDYPSWYSWQWKFIDGWKLDMSDSSFSFHWCNRFNVNILGQVATAAQLYVMCDWILDLIDAVVLNKHYPSCELLWNRNVPNLVSRKMVFFRLLLQKERDWYFGDVRISQHACCHLDSGCENPCCVSWILNCEPKSTNSNGSNMATTVHKRRVSRVTERTTRPRCRKEDTKNMKNRSKSKSKKRGSPHEKKITYNEVKAINDKINLPQEKSSCVIQ